MVVGGNLSFREKLGFENLAFRENGVDFRVGT
jgi:hypothetical protein